MIFTPRDRPAYERVLNLPIEAWENNGDVAQCNPFRILTDIS
jgi:hypothetical protein